QREGSTPPPPRSAPRPRGCRTDLKRADFLPEFISTLPASPDHLDRLTEPCEQCTRTDLDAGQGEERLMDVRPTLVPDAEPTVLVDPGQCPLDRPAGLTQPALVVDPLLGQDRLDTEFSQPLAVRLGVEGQVPLHGVGLLLRVAD